MLKRELFITVLYGFLYACDAAEDAAEAVNEELGQVDAGSGQVEFETDLPDDTVVSELSEPQRTAMNADLNAAVLSAVTAEDYCNQVALAAAASDMTDPSGRCSSVRDECYAANQLARSLGQDPKAAAQALVDESVPEQYRLGTQNVVFRGDVSNCDQLTVLKLEACLGDLGQGMVDGMRNVNCGSLSVEAAIQTLGRIAGGCRPHIGTLRRCGYCDVPRTLRDGRRD